MTRVVGGMATLSVVRIAGIAGGNGKGKGCYSLATFPDLDTGVYRRCLPTRLFPFSRVCRAGSTSRESGSEEKKKIPARLAQSQRLLETPLELQGEQRDHQPIPIISLDNVTVSFARSGGPGGQNVNKVTTPILSAGIQSPFELNTKVDMRFNVMGATWLPERVRMNLLQMEKNRINGDGELVVSSTRTRTQKGNIEDALEKLQEMIDAAAYVPPPPSEETKQRINKLAKIENERRLKDKRRSSSKKTERRNKGSWD